MVTPSSIPTLAFTAILLAASISDAARRRVPNSIVLALAGAGLVSQLWMAGPASLLGGLEAAAVVLALLWIPWVKGFLGGGDLKLAVAAAIWLEPARLPVFLLVGALAGGVVAIAVYASSASAERRQVRQNLTAAVLTGDAGMLPSGREASRAVPYAVAIAAGAITALLWRG